MKILLILTLLCSFSAWAQEVKPYDYMSGQGKVFLETEEQINQSIFEKRKSHFQSLYKFNSVKELPELTSALIEDKIPMALNKILSEGSAGEQYVVRVKLNSDDVIDNLIGLQKNKIGRNMFATTARQIYYTLVSCQNPMLIISYCPNHRVMKGAKEEIKDLESGQVFVRYLYRTYILEVGQSPADGSNQFRLSYDDYSGQQKSIDLISIEELIERMTILRAGLLRENKKSRANLVDVKQFIY